MTLSASIALGCAAAFWAFVGYMCWREHRADREAGRRFKWPDYWEW